MNILDISYLLDSKRVPGRSALVDVSESYFDSGPVTVSAGSIFIVLPTPVTGFIRLWTHLMYTVLVAGVAANDQFILIRGTQDSTAGAPLLQFFPPGGVGVNANIPLVGTAAGLAAGSANIWLTGIDPFFAGKSDKISFTCVIAAPTTQQGIIRGWFKDLP